LGLSGVKPLERLLRPFITTNYWILIDYSDWTILFFM